MTGLTYAEAADGADALELDGRRVPVIGLAPLLANKRATGCEQDRPDVAALERARDRG